jgi:hypothetical protein
MKFKLFIIFISCLTTILQLTFAQAKLSKIKIDRQFKDTLSFINKWDYPTGVYKDDSSGEFSTLGDSLDTTHLFFTANCSTNVQGGYEIRYCFADKNKGNLVLTFSDGLPAYASEYYIYIKSDSFYFRPKTIYPTVYPGEKISYHVTKQKLTLKDGSYKIGDTIIGYVDTEFIETVSVPKRGAKSHKYYLKGFIKTPLNERTKYGR